MTKKELNKKATVAGAAFVLMQLLIRGITFIITPVYSRLISKPQFGELRIYESWLIIFVPVMSLCLYRSVERAKYDFKDDFENYVSSTMTLSYISIALIYMVITLFFKNPFMEFCDINELMYVFMILYTFTHATMLYYQRREKQLLRYKNSSIATMATMLPATIFSVVLIYIGRALGHKEMLVELRVIGFYTPQIIGGLIIAVLIWKQGGFKVNTKYWKYALVYSLPLVPEMLSIQIMNQSDKIMIKKMVGSESAAVFTMGTTVSFIIWIIEDAVWGAWLPWLYEKINRDEKEEIQKPWYFIVLAFEMLTWLLIALAPELLMFLGGKEYNDAVYLVAPMVTGTLFRFFSNCFTALENYEKKTKFCALGSVIVMIINVVLNAVCIPRFGYQAAAYTTAFSYLLLMIVQGLFEKMVCGSRCISLGKMSVLAIVFFGINVVSMYLYSVPFYIRWLIVMLVGVITIIKLWPQTKKILKELKKK